MNVTGSTRRSVLAILTALSAACGGGSSSTPNAPTSAIATRVIGVSGNLAFGSIQAGTTLTATLTISNSGTSPLAVSSLTYPPGFSGNWSSGAIAPGVSQTVATTFAPVTAGTYGGSIIVNADQTSGINSIAVSGTATSAPVVGTWRGSVLQPGIGTYSITMVLQGPSGGTIAYGAPLNCSGIVTGTGQTGNEYRYSETLTQNAFACVPGGTIRVQPNGNTMRWQWDWPAILGNQTPLVATLTKQ